MSSGKIEQQTSIYEKLAKIAFLVFLFFIFFGTSMPFKEVVTDVEVVEANSSNRVNQVGFTLLLLVSCLVLYQARQRFFQLVLREKFLTLFIFWCFLTILWSQFPFVSFKRLIQVVTTITVIAAFLLHTENGEERLKYFKYILYPYVTISILSVLLIPGAVDIKFNTWRGLTATKNTLGQAGLVCTVIMFNIYRLEKKRNARIIAFFMTLFAFALMAGSQSGTSLISFTVLTLLGTTMIVMTALFRSAAISRFLFGTLMSSFFLIVFCLVVFAPDLLVILPGMIGKDITFTGRVDLWQDILVEANKHLLQGCGFSAFWVPGNYDMLVFFEKYVWLPNQSHQGYLDLLNEIGLIGVGFLLLMTAVYLKDVLKQVPPDFWKWLVVATLIINFQETTLFRPRHLTGVMYVYAYLNLYTNLLQQKSSVPLSKAML